MPLLKTLNSTLLGSGADAISTPTNEAASLTDSHNTAVAVLGGGQLSQMLAEAALALGLKPVVLMSSLRDPAARVSGVEAVLGDPADPAALRSVLSRVRAAAFENEFLDAGALEEAARGLSFRFTPGLTAFRRVQDKLEQKRIFRELSIPSARHEVFAGGNAQAWLSGLASRFPGGFVLKWSRQGYDGKGIRVVQEVTRAEEALDFVEAAGGVGARVYAEERVPFRRELALVACRSTTGSFATYPLVVSDQTAGAVCHVVRGPAALFGVAPALENEARRHAETLAEALPLEGTFTLEFFETPNGRLLVNEVAPRVHNSGHYTQDAASCSQFENHWRAVLGLPLGSVRTAPAFAMLNLLGPDGVDRKDPPAPPPPQGGAVLHWYGKDRIRPGRKMGHLNVRAQDAFELEGKLATMRAYERRWIESLKAPRVNADG